MSMLVDIKRHYGTALAVFEQHRAGLAVDAHDAALVALLDAVPLIGAVERHEVAHTVVGGERLLPVGVG